MKSRLALSTSSLVLFFVIACSSDSTAPSAGGPAAAATPGSGADLDKAFSARAAAYCAKVFDCCDAVSAKTLMTAFAGKEVARDACEAAILDTIKTQRTGALTALERKDLEFFPSKEADCVKAEEAKDCATFFAIGPRTAPKFVCGAAFTGKIKEGAACLSDGACESGYCKIETDIGKCAKRSAEGESCADPTDCQAGLYCHRTDNATPRCTFIEGVCKPPDTKANGQACCNDDECTSTDCAATNKGPQCVPLQKFKCVQ